MAVRASWIGLKTVRTFTFLQWQIRNLHGNDRRMIPYRACCALQSPYTSGLGWSINTWGVHVLTSINQYHGRESINSMTQLL